MIKFLFLLTILVIVIAVILYIVGRVFLHMPRAFQFKSEKEGGIFSEKWMKWLEEEAPQPFGEIIYEYVIPRKIRQVRYTKLHKVHFHAVINDKFYDTDIATEFWVKFTDFLGNEPCAKHYYRTQNGEFFCVTARLGTKDEFSAVPEKEMKKLLRNEPAIYAAYIPHASENKDLREFALRQKKKEEEEKAKEQEENNAEDTAVDEKNEKKKKVNKEEIKHSVHKAAGLFSESIEKLKKTTKAKKDAAEDEIKKDICKTVEESESKADVVAKKEPDITVKPTDVQEKQENTDTEEKVQEQKEEKTEHQEAHQENHPETVPEKKTKKPVPEVKPKNTESEDMDIPMDMMEAYIGTVEVEEEQTKKPKEKQKKKSTDIQENKKAEKPEAKKPETKKQSDKTVKTDTNEDANTKKDSSSVSENTVEKPKKPARPKRKKRSIRGPQDIESSDDIGFDNMDAVEKQREFETVTFTEPTQEDDEIEIELEKEEARKKEEENKKKLDDLDKAMSKMPRYRTVTKEE